MKATTCSSKSCGRPCARSYAVDWVDNARHAELALASDFYDVILFCVEGQQDSLSILKDYRAAGHTSSVVTLTARHAVAERNMAFDAGADVCLEKPVDIDEVAVWLRALMRRRAGNLLIGQKHSGQMGA